MNIDSKNRRWPQPGEQWLTRHNQQRKIARKNNTYLLLTDGNASRTRSGKTGLSILDLITYLK